MNNRPQMTRASWSRILGAAGACGLLVLAGTAAGQTALGDGRVLERSPVVGSGGYNAARPTIQDQIRLNNAIINGNATDGRSFRGYVGYRAPTDFGGRLGSDDLYSFRRDAATSGSFGSGVRGSDALRYQFALTTGQRVPQVGGVNLGVSQRAVTAASASNPAALRSTSDYLTSQSSRPSIIGGRVDEQGYQWTVKASPLLGVNWERSDAPVVRFVKPQDPLAKYDLGSTRAKESSQDDRRFVPGSAPEEMSPSDGRGPTARNDQQSLVASTRLEPVRTEQHLAVMQALKSGFEAGGESKSDATAPASANRSRVGPSLDEQLATLRRMLGGESTDQNGKDGKAQTTVSEATAQPQVTPDTPESSGVRDPLTGQRPRVPIDIPARRDIDKLGLSDTDAATRDAARKENPASALKINPNDPDTKPYQDNAGDGSGDRSAAPRSDRRPTADLIRAMKSVGRIDTLTKNPVNPSVRQSDMASYVKYMQSGQDALARERFFEAEEKFSRAISAMSADPMAQVGRIHAQLGAGLFLSAAANLRGLFAAHPELIGAEYGDNLVPTGERTVRIVELLRSEMKKEISGLSKDSALLIAYLGHIRHDEELVGEGLNEMARRFDLSDAAESTLLETVRAAWSK